MEPTSISGINWEKQRVELILMAGYPLASWQGGLHQPFKDVHNTSGMGQKVLLLKTLTCGWDTGDKKYTEACQRQHLEDLRLSWTEKSERLWSQLNCTVINGINICSLLSKCLKNWLRSGHSDLQMYFQKEVETGQLRDQSQHGLYVSNLRAWNEVSGYLSKVLATHKDLIWFWIPGTHITTEGGYYSVCL